MLIKDKNGNFKHRGMTEITISDLDKKLDVILAYSKKVESTKRIDRYVDDGLNKWQTLIQNTSLHIYQ